MISEVDIRDWEQVNIPQARKALDNMDDFARMANIEAVGPHFVLKKFIDQVELLMKQQIKQVPAILKKPIINPMHQWYIDRRIACPEADYPASEAHYATVQDYMDDNE